MTETKKKALDGIDRMQVNRDISAKAGATARRIIRAHNGDPDEVGRANLYGASCGAAYIDYPYGFVIVSRDGTVTVDRVEMYKPTLKRTLAFLDASKEAMGG